MRWLIGAVAEWMNSRSESQLPAIRSQISWLVWRYWSRSIGTSRS